MVNGFNLEMLEKEQRILAKVSLRPVQGDRFQPTGFADLGAALYVRPDGKRMILLETSQSMANRMEKVCLDGDGPKIAKELEGIPYMRVKLKGEADSETSSLVEAHRLNSPFIISNKRFQEEFRKIANYGKNKPLDWKAIGSAFFYYDPNSLVHGAFMANLDDGRIKTPRILTSFIEAEDVNEAASGGVKNNPLDPTGKLRAKDLDKDVYGNVPYSRMEYTASNIYVYFNIDLSLIRGYQLPKESSELLTLLSLYKIKKFLNGGLRLRTACDLAVVGDIQVTRPEGFTIPSENELLKLLQERIHSCKPHFNPPENQTIETDSFIKNDKIEGKK
ncbi:MAG: type I-U CRISPR-associated RAMP protein Csb1/Cas7u [Methanomassiliicoccales archaeon]|jgi:CRISPR-associated protein Csb1